MGIRAWKIEDREKLESLILAYLLEVQSEYDYEPTIDNARFLFTLGVQRADMGDPVVLAHDGERILGWTSWIGVDRGHVDFKKHVCIGMGTYVLPEVRRRGIAMQMHRAAEIIARSSGYQRIDRIASGGNGEKMLIRDGWKPAAIVYQKEL